MTWTKPIAAGIIVSIFLMAGSGSALAQDQSGDSEAAQQEEPSLYERLGGLPAISLAVSEFMDAFMQDPLIFANPAVKERKTPQVAPHIQYQVTTLLCQVTGGPCTYQGPDLKSAHEDLNVSAQEWDRMAEIFVATLDKLDVPERETEELLAILGGTRGDIVAEER